MSAYRVNYPLHVEYSVPTGHGPTVAFRQVLRVCVCGTIINAQYLE